MMTPDRPNDARTSLLAHPDRLIDDAPMGTMARLEVFRSREEAEEYARTSGIPPVISETNRGTVTLRVPEGIDAALLDLFDRWPKQPA